MKTPVLVVTSLLLAACSSSVDTPEAPPPPPPCETPIVTDWAGAASPPEAFQCDLPALCPAVTLFSDGQSELAYFDHPEAATCILTKLRDREPSALTFIRDQEISSGVWPIIEEVFVLDESHGASNWTQRYDTVKHMQTKNRQILKPSSYFSECLKLSVPADIYDCMVGWSDGCADIAVSCPVP